MNSQIHIRRVEALPADLDEELMPASIREDFKALKWLSDDWQTGVNRFSAPGEAFYVARYEDRLVGVCGVNRDPYANDAIVGRLRRMYVLPQFRRLGVGRRLVLRAINDAVEHFHTLRLRTTDEQASAFYEAMGFTVVKGRQEFTHEKRLSASS